MLKSNEQKANGIQHTNEKYKYEHPLSYLYKITYITHNSKEQRLYISICSYLDIQSLCRISVCNKEFNWISSSEDIWKPLCLNKWPELKMASSLKNDPFPIYKSCYKRKASVESTSMQDLMKIFGRCDWYSCPNGHLYAIGECRMAVMMSKCPECGEPIGGRFHRHLDTNHRIGAVNSSYNPMRYGMETEDKIEFKDVANVVHKTRQTGFDNNYKGINNNNNNRSLDTISENETSDWDKLKKQFEQMDDAPEYIVCPLSLDVFIDPVVTKNGSIYERKYIMDWLDNHDTDPLDSNIKLIVDDLESENDVKQAAELWRKQ
eukprot:37223_1